LYTKDKQLRGDTVKSWITLFSEAYVNEDISFIKSIREGKQPEITGIDGMAAVDIVRAGNESIKSRQIVRL
jgi:myo-inositol 2-dehydrogenase/D-chiro-inositol 1-dehydrogenase/scyllo-inositol 2-dehydrogenase (NAD+)